MDGGCLYIAMDGTALAFCPRRRHVAATHYFDPTGNNTNGVEEVEATKRVQPESHGLSNNFVKEERSANLSIKNSVDTNY